MSGKQNASEPKIGIILFPTDFTEHAYAALPWAQKMAQEHGAAIHLLHVLPDLPVAGEVAMYFADGAFMPEAFAAAARTRLETEAKRFPGMWRPCKLETRLGDPASTIDDYAREIGADLIVMSTHQPGWWERLFVGSVAERTLRHAPCPVLVVPVGCEAGAGAA